MASSPAECLCLSLSWMNEKDNFIVDCKGSSETVFKLVCPQWKHREVHRSAHGYDRLGRRHRMRRKKEVTELCTHTIATGVVSGVVFSRLLSRLLSDKAVYQSESPYRIWSCYTLWSHFASSPDNIYIFGISPRWQTIRATTAAVHNCSHATYTSCPFQSWCYQH